MKILITGGAGFIGSHLVDRLIKGGHKVAVIDSSSGRRRQINKNAKFYKINIGDVRTFQIFKKEKPEIVFHLAGPINLRRPLNDPLFFESADILGNLRNLLGGAKGVGVKKFIFISSGGAICADAKLIPTPESYPCQPKTLYGLANLLIEKYIDAYCRSYNLNYAILRLSNVYGPRQWSSGIIPSMISSIISRKKIIINGNGRQIRDFIFIDDVIDILLLNAFIKKENILYNVASGTGVSINRLLSQTSRILDRKVEVVYNKHFVDVKKNILDTSKIKTELHWKPKVDLETGLKKTIDWFINKKIIIDL